MYKNESALGTSKSEWGMAGSSGKCMEPCMMGKEGDEGRDWTERARF